MLVSEQAAASGKSQTESGKMNQRSEAICSETVDGEMNQSPFRREKFLLLSPKPTTQLFQSLFLTGIFAC